MTGLQLVPFDEESLFSADSEKDRATLVDAMQHDMKQPLQVISLSHRALGNKLVDRESVHLVRAAESAYEDLRAHIDDALDAFRLFGLRSTKTEEVGVSLSVLLLHLEEKHKEQAKLAGIKLKVHPSRLFVVTDKRLITRVITNLVLNAISHSKATELVVGARWYTTDSVDGEPEGGVQIEVMDNGRGIAEEDLPNIFRPGYRGRQNEENRAPGQGLGLFNVHGLVHRLKGRLLVRSRPGCTHFRIQIPCYVEREKTHAAPRVTSDKLSGKIVAIVDDQQSVLDLMRITFEGLGAKVMAQTDDLRMLGELHDLDRCPDLFLLDFMIGPTFVDKIIKPLQSKYGRENLRIIIITGQPSHPRLKTGELASSVPVLEKPLSKAHLDTIIDIVTTGRPFTKADFA